MPATILDGAAVAKQVRLELAAAVAERVAAGRSRPGLAAVLVGDDPASHVYVRNKRRACEQADFASRLHQLPADVTQRELLALVAELNSDPAVHGILVQMPLPKSIDDAAVLLAVDPAKDVDGFHPNNLGLLTAGTPRFLACTPVGVRELLTRSGVETAGRHAVVVGRSNIVGKPLALILGQKPTKLFPEAGDCTVTIAHSATRNLAEVCRSADILVAAIGRPEFIGADMVKPGAAVVDVGINRVGEKLVGDVAFGPVSEVAGFLSPVPGGVGPMTIAMLLRNTLRAATLSDA